MHRCFAQDLDQAIVGLALDAALQLHKADRSCKICRTVVDRDQLARRKFIRNHPA